MTQFIKVNAAGTKKAVIIKQENLYYSPDRKYMYNVQIWHYMPNLHGYFYSGDGRFCETLNDACKFACVRLRG